MQPNLLCTLQSRGTLKKIIRAMLLSCPELVQQTLVLGQTSGFLPSFLDDSNGRGRRWGHLLGGVGIIGAGMRS